MKKMKRLYLFKIYLFLMALLFCHVGQAQEIKLSKSIDKTFEVSDRLNLEITNKYGNVIIDTWSQDEVSLNIEILAYGKDDNAAEKLMDRVEFDFKHSDDYLEVVSVFDRKKSFFRDLVNTVGDYSASLLSKHKLQINYELTIPESTSSIMIDNRFGDIHLDNVQGRINITLAHGDFRANKLEDFSRLNINYGKARIKEVTEMNLSLKGAELELDYADKLSLKSSSSTIIVGKVMNADVESTNDNIEISNVRDISGTANFTEMSILYLSEICRLNQSYGEMAIKNIHEDFKSIRLDGKSTDYQLNFSKNSSFGARIYARDDKLVIAEYPGQREKKYMDDKSKFVQITGNFGGEDDESNLTIDAQNGEVIIDFVDALPETYNK